MCNIDRIKYSCRIIRVYVTDEFGFHLECVILLSPVLKCKIHCTRSEITSTDTDLYNRCKFLTGSVCDLSCMYFICKICDLSLLFCIECTLVHSVSLYRFSKLSTCHVMKYQTFLSCIDHFSVIECFEFFCQLSFIC